MAARYLPQAMKRSVAALVAILAAVSPERAARANCAGPYDERLQLALESVTLNGTPVAAPFAWAPPSRTLAAWADLWNPGPTELRLDGASDAMWSYCAAP